MSLTRARIGAAGIALLVPLASTAAWADDADRFFRAPGGDDEETSGGELRGSLTSTTFAAMESAREAEPVQSATTHESEALRFFTDLRARLDRDELAGMDLHADLRLRLTSSELGFAHFRRDEAEQRSDGVEPVLQSGVFGGPEYDIRQLYAIREGETIDLTFGRQIVGELAATRIDGVRLTHRGSGNWNYLGFAGLYPARGSRSITEDYPLSRTGINGETGAPILPVAAGGGTTYRYDRLYGSLGVVGIAPLAEDRETGELETPRIFATSSGYWRQSLALDLFHHLVVDGLGAAVEASDAPAVLTNLHLGANYRPADDLRVSASVTRVDTETLNVIAQRRLRDRVQERQDAGLIQNHLQVTRIAQESARLGVSAALADRRFEVSTIGALRRRPEVRIDQGEDAQATIPSAQAADVTLRAVDRRFFFGTRLEASLTEIFGVGANNLHRGRSRIGRVKGSRPFADGRGTFELTASYLNGADQYRGDACLTNTGALETFDLCYGTTELHSGTLGALVFYRINGSWMALGGLEGGVQQQFTVDSDLEEVRQPPIVLTSGFARVAYRF